MPLVDRKDFANKLTQVANITNGDIKALGFVAALHITTKVVDDQELNISQMELMKMIIKEQM